MAERLADDFPFLTELERYDAFLRLYHSRDPAHRRSLVRLVGSRDPLVALIVLQYLEDIPERRALDAVLHLVERGNEVVSRAAMSSYKRSHYPGKARRLKRLILSRNTRACRFAVRTLSHLGFAEILPLILRELPDAAPEVRAEMIEALRCLPDRRSVRALAPLADDPDAAARAAALQALADLQPRVGGLPAAFFLKRTRDPAERVRRAALDGLRAFPTRQVARLLLAQAADPAEPPLVRERAARALAAFPAARWVRPLAALAAGADSSSMRLAVEVALRAFPERALRRGLLALLGDPDAALRRQAAGLAAELLGRDPETRARLFALWDAAPDPEAAELAEVLHALGGPEAAAKLRAAVGRSTLVAFSAAAALARLRGQGKHMLEVLRDPGVSDTVRQAILSQWARRGPDEESKDELKLNLVEWLKSPVINIRYLALQILAWFPLSAKLEALLDMLAVESDAEVVATVSRQILAGLGSDPIPLAAALGAHPERRRLLGHAVRLFTAQAWDPALAPTLLTILAHPPLSLLEASPETFVAVCAHVFSHGAVTLQDLWSMLPEEGHRRILLRLLASFMRDPRRRFPALPLEFLADMAGEGDPERRALVYALLAEDARPASVEALTAALVREPDEATRARGAALMRRVLGAA